MKKFIIMSALGLATVAGLSSCSDFLDTDNKSTVTPDSQFSDIAGWNQQLNNAYYALKECDGLIITGATGTNVNDIAVLLIKR